MGRAPNPKSTQSPSDLQYQKQKKDPSNAFDQQAEPAHKAERTIVLSKTLGHKVEDTLSISPTHPLNLLYLLDYFPVKAQNPRFEFRACRERFLADGTYSSSTPT
jgi:hypothetical protein